MSRGHGRTIAAAPDVRGSPDPATRPWWNAERALRWSRLIVLAVAVCAILWGLYLFYLEQPANWLNLDGARVALAGRTWAAGGDPYLTAGFVYAPPMVLVASLLPGGIWPAWAVIEVACVIWAAWDLGSPIQRVLAVLVALSWPGVWTDIVLGNVTVAIVATALLAIRGDSLRRGIPFGIALALVPKPLALILIPWLFVHNRRSFSGMAWGAVGTSAIGLLALGPGIYQRFAGALLVGIDPRFPGNNGLSYIDPLLGLIAALAGLFVGTYVGTYASIVALAVLPIYARARPAAATAMGALTIPIQTALPLAGAVAFVTMLVASARGRPSAGGDTVVAAASTP